MASTPPAADAGATPAGRSSTAGSVRLPPKVLAGLSGRCGEIGARGVAALREAGRRVGRELVDGGSGEGISADLPLDRFWEELRRAAADRGFGHVRYEVLSGDVARVDLRASPEAASGPARDGGPSRPGCHFAAGWLGGALTAAAGDAVAVLEVRCSADPRSDSCRFLVGPERRLERLRVALRGGATVEEALASD